MKAEEGDKVQLGPFEDQPAQVGTVLRKTPIRYAGHPQMYIVLLNPEYRNPEYDDGLRELTEDQIEKILGHTTNLELLRLVGDPLLVLLEQEMGPVKDRARPDFDPRVDYPERYTDGPA